MKRSLVLALGLLLIPAAVSADPAPPVPAGLVMAGDEVCVIDDPDSSTVSCGPLAEGTVELSGVAEPIRTRLLLATPEWRCIIAGSRILVCDFLAPALGPQRLAWPVVAAVADERTACFTSDEGEVACLVAGSGAVPATWSGGKHLRGVIDLDLRDGLACAARFDQPLACWSPADGVVRSDAPGTAVDLVALTGSMRCAAALDGPPLCAPRGAESWTISDAPAATDLVAGPTWACVLDLERRPWCWDPGSDGEAAPLGADPVREVAVGETSACVLTGDGDVVCRSLGPTAT